MRLLIAHVTV